VGWGYIDILNMHVASPLTLMWRVLVLAVFRDGGLATRRSETIGIFYENE
jgi:hypothetical protein